MTIWLTIPLMINAPYNTIVTGIYVNYGTLFEMPREIWRIFVLKLLLHQIPDTCEMWSFGIEINKIIDIRRMVT